MAAQGRGKTDGHRLRVFLEAVRQILAGLDRRIGIDREHHIVVEQRGDGREVSMAELAGADDMVGEQRGGAHHQVVRVAGVLIDVVESDGAAAAGLVDDGERGVDEFLVVEDFLDLACGLVVAAAGGRTDDDFHVLLRRPGLGPAGGAERHHQYCEWQTSEFHESSGFMVDAGRALWVPRFRVNWKLSGN
jgi:hypothetical protein